MAKTKALPLTLNWEEVEREPVLKLPFCHPELHGDGGDERRVGPGISLLEELEEVLLTEGDNASV